MAGDDAKRLSFADPTDPDRQVILDRKWKAARVVDTKMRSGERGALVGEQRADDLRRLVEHVESHADTREVVAERLRLLFVPAAPKAEFEASVAEMVECCRGFRQHARCAIPDVENQATDAGALCCRGECAEHRERFEVVERATRRGCLVEVIPCGYPVEVLIEHTPCCSHLGHGHVLLADVGTEAKRHVSSLPDRRVIRSIEWSGLRWTIVSACIIVGSTCARRLGPLMPSHT